MSDDGVPMECEDAIKEAANGRNKKKRKRKKQKLSPEEGSFRQLPFVSAEKEPDQKKKKNPTKTKNEYPSISYSLDELFSNNGKRPGGSHLNFQDIRSLLMLTIHGDMYPCLPTWCRVNAWQNIMKTVVIMAGYVSEQDYHDYRDCFHFLNSRFLKPVPVRNEGNHFLIKSPLESFLQYRMTKKLQALKKAEREAGNHEILNVHQFVLNENQLRANEFPEWNSSAKEHGIVTTRRDGKHVLPNKTSKLLAIDCEMCNVQGNERALTRISIVDSNLKTIYDKLVKPRLPIVDYLTEYSGITAKMLENVTTSLFDVQKDLLTIIEPNSILVGHSLDFDLRALKLHHDNVIDTSVLFVDQRRPRFKSSLKSLVKTYLQRDIQNSSAGHCSIEDAKSCMELVLMKIQKGVSFGNPESDCESLYEALTRAAKRGALLDSATIVRQHCHGNNHSIPCLSDEQVVSNSQRLVKEVDFVFAHLKEYENIIKGTDSITEETRERAFKNLDESISNIMANVVSQTLVIVSLSSGYIPPDIMKMTRDKELRKSDVVKEAVKKARNGLCFVKIT